MVCATCGHPKEEHTEACYHHFGPHDYCDCMEFKVMAVPRQALKFFTMCQGGNVRSVGLTYAIKHYGQQAIAAGWETASPDTIRMLCEWADYVMPMQAEFVKYIPKEFHGKVKVIDVGPDTYGYPNHPTLQNFFMRIVKEWSERDWKL